MMKNTLWLAILLPIFSMAQVISPSTNQLDFGNVKVGEINRLELTLENTSSDSLNVTDIRFYSIYDETPFSASDTAFGLAGKESKTIEVYFTPKQNIYHNMEMVVLHDASSGFEAIDLLGQGQFPLNYYDTTENLSEEDLKKAIKWRLGQGYKELSYNAARDEMYLDIDNQRTNGQGATINTVKCVYTGTVKSGYTSRSNVQTTNPNFNTEHTFPQGFFNSILPERSDIHHLFTTTNSSNSQRGSKKFGEVNGGSASGGGSFYNSSAYEPRDEQKGSTARAMMYFVLRYQDYANHFSGQESTLLDWHEEFLPDNIEENRNADIFDVQKNRNPFVDYPQLSKRISKFVANSAAPSVYALDTLVGKIDFGIFTQQLKDTFDYVLINHGNEDIQLGNFSLSNTSILSFNANNGVDTILKAGESLVVSIVAETQTSTFIDESLSFSTSLPGGSNYVIPIIGEATVAISEDRLVNDIQFYPNPLQEKLYIRNEKGHQLDIRLLDALGRETDLKFLQNSNGKVVLSTEDLAKGFYFLELKEGNHRLLKKLVK